MPKYEPFLLTDYQDTACDKHKDKHLTAVSLIRRCSLMYSKTCVKQPLSKRPKVVFQDQLSLDAGQKNCRMLQGEHSAILATFIKLPFVIKIFVLSIFEWPFYTGFTVCSRFIRKSIGYTCSAQTMIWCKKIKLNIIARDNHMQPSLKLMKFGCNAQGQTTSTLLLSTKSMFCYYICITLNKG